MKQKNDIPLLFSIHNDFVYKNYNEEGQKQGVNNKFVKTKIRTVKYIQPSKCKQRNLSSCFSSSVFEKLD